MLDVRCCLISLFASFAFFVVKSPEFFLRSDATVGAEIQKSLTTKNAEDAKIMKSDEQVLELCDIVRQTAFDIHKYLGSGFLEKVYQNALQHRLSKMGHKVAPQVPLIVRDEDETVLGEYFADLFVEDCLIIEIKACKALADEHIAQIFGYLRASNIKHGLLINFGSQKFEIRKFAYTRT